MTPLLFFYHLKTIRRTGR